MSILPIIGYEIRLRDFASLFFQKSWMGADIEKILAAKEVLFLDSGRSACAVILEALKGRSKNDEVVLPAYTATALVEAVRHAGLKVALCDLPADDFNASVETILSSVTPQTLAVVGVHMFGLPFRGFAELRQQLSPDVVLIEDCCQAMGTMVDNRPVGTSGDVSFFSFNRGKNLPTYGGGCIVNPCGALARDIQAAVSALKKPTRLDEVTVFFKLFCLMLAFQRAVYGWIYPWISEAKAGPGELKSDFVIKGYGDLRRHFGAILGERFEEACRRRSENGVGLLNGLSDLGGIVLPKIKEGERVAFNRFPVYFRDPSLRSQVRAALLRAGIESSEFYFKPLHHMFDLGYPGDHFPNSVRFAQGLLTLPVHPLVTAQDIETMVGVIRGVVKS